jgi:fatty-acyl-CoA synthase
MLGLMQDWPLRLHRIIDHAARHHPGREVVSRSVEGATHRTRYAEVRARALRLAQRLAREGVRPGDRVATLAWNTWRHLEAWFGISGAGAIYHTVNPRLFPDQIAWILNHAESRLALADLSFVPLLEKLAGRLPHVERYVVLTDAAHMPDTPLRGAIPYEEWIAEADGDFAWAGVEENAACGLCYTSGTTGDPKGVLYSHRALVLLALMALQPDVFGMSVRDRVAPAASMFHANAWVVPYAAAMCGAALVLPGPRLDGASLHALFEEERATVSAGVPTVWAMLLQHLEATGGRFSTLERLLVGGTACPRSLIEAYGDRFGVRIVHAWGMTEMSPIGTCGGGTKPELAGLGAEAALDLRAKQGYPPFTVDMKITDDDGRALPWDGATFGRLKVAGPGVVKGYFRADNARVLDEEGFFDTGDVATIDAHGIMQITDRAKDVIKSGGEWISSVAIENLAAGHPGVAEAAVVAVPHPKWDERPLLVGVPKLGAAPTREDLLAFLEGKVAKWWMPDDVAFVEELPHTATGKVEKKALREMFKDRGAARRQEGAAA